MSDGSSDVCSSALPRHGLRSRGDGGARLAGIMGAAEEFQHIRIEALHADRQPVDAGRGKGGKLAGLGWIRVGFQRDLDVVGKTPAAPHRRERSEEHTSELQSLLRTSSALLCLKKKN